MAKFSKDKQPERRGDPVEAGKSNGRRTIMTDALMLALNEEVAECAETGVKTKRLRIIANKLAALAEQGDIQAIKEIFDRTQGKAAQALQVTGNDDGPIETTGTITFIPVGAEYDPNQD